MKKTLCIMVFIVANFTFTMESSKIEKSNDTIKNEKGAVFNSQVIEALNMHLLIINKELSQNNLPEIKKKLLEKNLTVMNQSLNLICGYPLQTYTILQNHSKVFAKVQHIELVNKTSDLYFSQMRQHFQKLNELYQNAQRQAYEEISTQYSVNTILLLNELLQLNNSFKKGPALTEEIHKKLAEESNDILQKAGQIINSPFETYSILLAFNQKNQQKPQEKSDKRSVIEIEFIQNQSLIIGKLSELYEKIIQ